MANKIKGINIKIGADTKGLDTALKGIESAGKKATSELREVNSSLRNNNESVVLWKQKQELLTTALEESRKKLDFLREAQEQIKRQFENNEIDSGQYRAFQREIETAQRDVNSFESQLQQANTRLEELTRTTEESTEQIDELGDEIQESGEQAESSANGGYTVLGNVFANVITKGIELAWTTLKNFTQDVVATGAEYESAISNVVAISGAMSEEVEMLQAKAEEMGATTKFTAAESAEAMGYMAMAGWKTEDMLGGIEGIMNLAAASGEDLATTSDIVTDALTAFGLTAGDSAHFADVLAAASSNANTNVAMMGETFKYAAPVAGSLGFSIEDTAEAIGLMANSGIKASQAGTSLRRILTELSGSIMLTGDKLGQFTVNTSNADGSMRNLSDILADLRTGWEQLTESEQAANAQEIVGTNAMSGFLALMNSAPADIDKLSTAIENADGTAKGMASTMLDNLQGDRTLFESAFDGVKIAVSKELNPALRDIVQWGTKQMPKVQAVVEPLFKGAVNGVKSLINGFEKLKPVLSGTAIAATGVATALIMTKTVTFFDTKFIPILKSAGTAVKSLWGVVSANPIIAVTVAVGALTAGLIAYKNSQLDVKTEGEKLIEQQNKEIRLLTDKRRAIEDLNDAFYENVDGIQNQTDRTKDLWKELDKLADQYGNVQQKDKARAEYILNELNNALGTEYTMTGNQIDNYRILSAEIDNVIAKKQAEMMLDAYLANSTEMTKHRIEARTDYEKADKDYQEKKKILEEARKEYKKVSGNSWENLTREVDKTKAFNIIDADSFLYSNPEKYAEAAKKLWIADNEERQARSLKNEAEKNYQATSEYFGNLEQIQEAYSLGQYDLMAEIIYAEKDLTSTTLDESATDAEKRLEIYSESLQKTLSDFELAVKDMKQKSVDEMEKKLSDTMQTALQAGVDPAEVWANFKDGFYELQAKGLDISPLVTPLVESGASPAKIFGKDWQEVFRNQLKNGGDMEEMLKWLNNSGYYNSISSVFGDDKNFIKYLKEQSRKGFDISEMLELGAESGLAESEEFVKIFKSQVSKNIANDWNVANLLETGNKWGIDLGEEFGESFGGQLQTLADNGIDLEKFLKWAESNGKSVADVFGENFKNELSAYMKNKTLTAFESLKESGNAFVDFFYNKSSLTDRLIKSFSNGKDISNLAEQAQKSGLKIGTVFGNDFMNVVQEQVNSGYEIKKLIRWAVESGEKISEEYSDVYTDVVQTCIDKGYNIEELLRWGEKSGLSTADTFGKKYTPEAQSFIDRGFAVDSLLSWARTTGINAGKLFGENFQSYANMYIADKRAELERAMNSSNSFISNRVSEIFGNLPFMADGGFLSHGQAIVAEAGPELLEVMNGGVKVTPLTRSAQNTPVSDGGQKIFYSNYTINATISGGYDVRRLAEELETERRRIENGRGM